MTRLWEHHRPTELGSHKYQPSLNTVEFLQEIGMTNTAANHHPVGAELRSATAIKQRQWPHE
jgi:hypothetical protein